jgi:hypothetical protein
MALPTTGNLNWVDVWGGVMSSKSGVITLEDVVMFFMCLARLVEMLTFILLLIHKNIIVINNKKGDSEP